MSTPDKAPTKCELGRVEGDGYAYCFEHGGFWSCFDVQNWRKCDRRLNPDDGSDLYARWTVFPDA